MIHPDLLKSIQLWAEVRDTPLFSRLFYIHHSKLDTYDKINPRELAMGAAAMAAMVALISKYGS